MHLNVHSSVTHPYKKRRCDVTWIRLHVRKVISPIVYKPLTRIVNDQLALKYVKEIKYRVCFRFKSKLNSTFRCFILSKVQARIITFASRYFLSRYLYERLCRPIHAKSFSSRLSDSSEMQLWSQMYRLPSLSFYVDLRLFNEHRAKNLTKKNSINKRFSKKS